MMNSIKKSLDYFTHNFGPYYHKEARIIEFPRVASFAQAFAGTMPYSESIGFIANLNHPDDIDMVYYVVAHEMGHQWWAHQVIGANMQGATLLSESLAQYSALMVMEKEYGRDIMRKFLRYEMDNYLRSRGQETSEGAPARHGRGAAGLHPLPQGQRGALLPQGDDRRGRRQSGAPQIDPAIRLRAAAVSHFLGPSGRLSAETRRISVPDEGSV